MLSNERVCVIEHAPVWSNGIKKTFIEEGIATPDTLDIIRVHKGEQLPEIANYSLLALSGGEMGVYELDKPEYRHIKDEYKYVERAILLGVPVVGFCLGHQFLGSFFGSRVIRNEAKREIGYYEVTMTEKCKKIPSMCGLPDKMSVFLYHNDHVESQPSNSLLLATTENSPLQILYYPNERVMSFQFHPEMCKDNGNFLFRRDKKYLASVGLDYRNLVASCGCLDDQGRRHLLRKAVVTLGFGQN